MGVDNSDVVYQFDSNPNLSAEEQAFNDGVVRVTADPQGRKGGLAQVPRISGDIGIPVLTLHNLGDLFVPIRNEIEYATRVNAHGKSDLLVQRAIRGVGHCDFTAAEFSSAFLDLVSVGRDRDQACRRRLPEPGDGREPELRMRLHQRRPSSRHGVSVREVVPPAVVQADGDGGRG